MHVLTAVVKETGGASLLIRGAVVCMPAADDAHSAETLPDMDHTGLSSIGHTGFITRDVRATSKSIFRLESPSLQH